MAQPLLRWIEGDGWLVFSGGDPQSSIRSQALARATGDRAIAYISLADDGGDGFLEDMDDLGAPTGYIVDLVADSEAEIAEQLANVSMIAIEAGTGVDALYEALMRNPVAVEAMRVAYEQGTLILVEGLACNVFGRWVVADDGEQWQGLNWLEDAFIEPQATSADESRAVQDILSQHAQAISIEIGPTSALALGPGRIELWGERQVTISLGRAYSNEGEE